MTQLKVFFCVFLMSYLSGFSALECGPSEHEVECDEVCESDFCPKSEQKTKFCKMPTKCPHPVCKCFLQHRRAANGTCIPVQQCHKIRINEPATEPPTTELPTTDQLATEQPTTESPATQPQITTDSTEAGDTTTTSKPELECGPYEMQDDCPVDCQSDYCPKNEEEAKITECNRPKDKKDCPPPKCKCGFNSRYSANGTCISVYDCPPFTCDRPNEEYQVCPSYCPGESCDHATPDGKCPAIFGLLPVLYCQPACRCIKNYWRKDGVCVPYAECGKGTTTPSPETTTAPTNNEPCSQAQTCGPLEKLECRVSCQKDTCDSINARYHCIENEVCKDGCYCIDGYYRPEEGKPCVEQCECEQMKNADVCQKETSSTETSS